MLPEGFFIVIVRDSRIGDDVDEVSCPGPLAH
jgi:hypothetical protein